MLKEVMMFITGKGTASLSESLSDSIIKKMQEQHARELAEQKAADEERFRKMDETHLLVKCDVEEEARHRNELISEGKATGKPVPLRDDSPVGDGLRWSIVPDSFTVNLESGEFCENGPPENRKMVR